MIRSLCLTALAYGMAAQANATIVFTAFAPSVYSTDTAAMDATLGITGLDIEDFEDTTLLPGLSYTLNNVPFPFTSLPAVHVAGGIETGNTNWDGVAILLGNNLNSLSNSANAASEVTLSFATGQTLVGIGLSSFQSLASPAFPRTDHEWSINGVSQGRIEDLAEWSPGLERNLYLVLEASGGDLIHSVTFTNLPGLSDVLAFDHIAFAAIPEPTLGAPIAIAAACLAGTRRLGRRRR